MTGFGRSLVGPSVRFVGSAAALLVLSFLLIRLVPGDPVRASLGLTAPVELVTARRAALGLDRPMPEQLAHYVGGLAQGDMGLSFMSQLPVADIIAQRLPNTVRLAALALACAFLGGTAAGLAAAVSRTRSVAVDRIFVGGTGLLSTVPEFVTAVLSTAVFAVALHWLPVAGMTGPASFVLPVFALALAPAAALARIVRVEAIRVLAQDYMLAARAKRLSRWRRYLIHALPNCMTATLTAAGLIFGGLLTGTVLVENVFAWPGIGSTLVLSILQKDFPLTQGLILTFGLLVLLTNLAIDLLIALIDPRTGLRR
jgi:peptide/nickel transport system permease protein